MKATIITIGDELLMGQTVDTNSAWIGQEMTELGIKVHEILSISDNRYHIMEALDRASGQGDIILITGGLGPTKDDLTKITIADYFNVELKHHEPTYQRLKAFFESRGRQMLPRNEEQAMIPVNCEVVPNEKGTAPGMWFFEDGKAYVSMPGVPYEMKKMMKDTVIPKLQQTFELPKIYHRHIMTAGVGESVLAEKVEPIADRFPEYISLAYLPGPGTVKLRVTGNGSNLEMLKKEVNARVEQLSEACGKYFYGYDNESLEDNVSKLLRKEGKRLVLAESCTGGFVSHLITAIPGASEVYDGSVAVYSYEAKERLLNVKHDTLTEFGAVSEEVVKEMAAGVLQTLGGDYGIAISGIAGPGGGLPDKPVGTVWIAVSSKEQTIARRFQFTNQRDLNIKLSAVAALMMLRRLITGYYN